MRARIHPTNIRCPSGAGRAEDTVDSRASSILPSQSSKRAFLPPGGLPPSSPEDMGLTRKCRDGVGDEEGILLCRGSWLPRAFVCCIPQHLTLTILVSLSVVLCIPEIKLSRVVSLSYLAVTRSPSSLLFRYLSLKGPHGMMSTVTAQFLFPGKKVICNATGRISSCSEPSSLLRRSSLNHETPQRLLKSPRPKAKNTPNSVLSFPVPRMLGLHGCLLPGSCHFYLADSPSIGWPSRE